MNRLSYNAISYEADDPVERIEDLKWTLMSLPAVEDVEETYNNEDLDGHLVLNMSSEIMEPAVEEEIKEADAWMKPPEFVDGGMQVEVMLSDIPTEEFNDSGSNQVRKRGGSMIIAIPPDSAEQSEIEVGDQLDFYSRKGEILIQEDNQD